jgi:hypothetical protein
MKLHGMPLHALHHRQPAVDCSYRILAQKLLEKNVQKFCKRKYNDIVVMSFTSKNMIK